MLIFFPRTAWGPVPLAEPQRCTIGQLTASLDDSNRTSGKPSSLVSPKNIANFTTCTVLFVPQNDYLFCKLYYSISKIFNNCKLLFCILYLFYRLHDAPATSDTNAVPEHEAEATSTQADSEGLRYRGTQSAASPDLMRVPSPATQTASSRQRTGPLRRPALLLSSTSWTSAHFHAYCRCSQYCNDIFDMYWWDL